MQQNVLIKQKFRHPIENEELMVIRDWYKDFRKETKTKSLGYCFASIFMLLAVTSSIITIFIFFKSLLVSFLFFVATIVFFRLAEIIIRNEKQSQLELDNLLDKAFIVRETTAINLQIVNEGVDAPRYCGYVDILSPSKEIAVKNVKIPLEIARNLEEEDISFFPCLLINLKDKKDFIATPLCSESLKHPNDCFYLDT